MIMRLYTSDEIKMVDVGTGSIWYSVYSTAEVTLSKDAKKEIPLALNFLKTGDCRVEDLKETKTQLVVVQNAFKEIEPDKAVYDLHKPDVAAPWAGNIAPTVTSLANLYTTADGKDLLTEVISLLEYASEKKVAVFAG